MSAASRRHHSPAAWPRLLPLLTLLLAGLPTPALAVDWLQYIASYPDLIRAFGANPALGERHYLQYGRSEGRALDLFGEQQYLANYPDLQRAFGTDTGRAVEHFVRYGLVEGRTDDPPTPPARPDIVFVLVDDMGAAVIGPERRSVDVATPNIDALAAAGTTYTQAYAAPACVPSRVMALSGRWPYRNSVGAVWNNGPTPPGSMVTIAERLRGVGYETRLVGKWQLGTIGGKHPLDQGFDHFLGFHGDTPDYYGADPDDPLWRDRTRILNTGYVTDTLAGEAETVLRTKRERPLFLLLSLTAIHDPLQTTMAFAVGGVDRALGRVVAAAKPDTLFIFAGDNGRFVNTPLRGAKYDIWEGGVRVPFIAAWRGRIAAGQSVATPVSLLDVAPTAMAATGAPVPAALDGLSLLSPLPAERRIFFGAMGRGGVAVRQGRWKLYLGYHGVPTRLYDLETDKGENLNVAAGYAGVVQPLTAALHAWQATIDD
jgi:arylsulfatase A-like enzyme